MGFSRIFDVLQHSLESYPQFKKSLTQAIIIEKWPEIVGRAIAAHAHISRITEEGTLYISVNHSLWTSEIINRRFEILEKINADPHIAQRNEKITAIKCFSAYQKRPFRTSKP